MRQKRSTDPHINDVWGDRKPSMSPWFVRTCTGSPACRGLCHALPPIRTSLPSEDHYSPLQTHALLLTWAGYNRIKSRLKSLTKRSFWIKFLRNWWRSMESVVSWSSNWREMCKMHPTFNRLVLPSHNQVARASSWQVLKRRIAHTKIFLDAWEEVGLHPKHGCHEFNNHIINSTHNRCQTSKTSAKCQIPQQSS